MLMLMAVPVTVCVNSVDDEDGTYAFMDELEDLIKWSCDSDDADADGSPSNGLCMKAVQMRPYDLIKWSCADLLHDDDNQTMLWW